VDSGLTEYKSAMERLFARTGSTSKFGLERTEALLSLLGDPNKRIRFFHVAGTNGKGSVVATIYALLRAKGFHVGRYTSPHLVDFRERIVVDDEEISEREVLDFIARWEGENERLGATFFEITTALALSYFAAREVDVAIIETGLGGRLDSTNVITPLVAGVTSIGVDHTEYLGNTIAQIAHEKGGIFKRGVPAVYGPVSEVARDALLLAASDAGADPVVAALDLYRPDGVRVTASGTEFEVEHAGESATLQTGLIGEPQASNTCVALAMLDLAGPEYRVNIAEAQRALPFVSLPGRFQRVGKFILDVAHNPDGIRALVASLGAVAPERPVAAVLGVLGDKDWQQMMSLLCPAVDRTVLTAPASAPANRAWDPERALDFGRSNGWQVKLERHLSAAVAHAAATAGTVVVTGSFHTVGEASLLGLRSLSH
jgi:dihydrofolate synthase/folylpolyglutamate synthase